MLYNVSVLSALDANLGEEEEEEDEARPTDDGDRRLKKGTGIAEDGRVGGRGRLTRCCLTSLSRRMSDYNGAVHLQARKKEEQQQKKKK